MNDKPVEGFRAVLDEVSILQEIHSGPIPIFPNP